MTVAEPLVAPVAALRDRGVVLDTDSRRIAEYSYDASNYRIRPLGVVFPRTPQEVATTLAVCFEQGIPVISRGGGTSMAGGAVGAGIVIDFSRFMNQVLYIDAQAKQATAEA